MESRPRRKRVDRGETSTSSNGVTHHSDHSQNNGNYVVNHNEDDSSSSATAHRDKSNRTNGKGARVVARRKRIQSRRKQKRLRTLIQWGIYIATFFFLLYCCIQITTLQRSVVGPTISNSSTTKQTNSASFPIANNKSNDGNGETISNKHPYNEEYERRLLNKIPNHNKPLTEEEEQDILNEAHDELNQFPISIGTDDNGNNLDWETIQHPGTEALKFFTGSAPRKKRPTAQDLAGVLSGKKLRGADKNDNLGDGSENSTDEGYMRVPKFWDPVPYRIIADEREKRSGITAYHDLPRDGVRRYLGNFGSRIMTPIEAKSIGSRIPSSTDNSELLETIFVAIASYRDYQCSHTVDSAFSRATHPERIRVAVVDQIRLGEDKPCSLPPNGLCEFNANQPACKYQSQIDYFTIDAELSVGPVFARHLGHRLYRGEYFAVQSDAHVEFVLGWDDEIIEQWHTAKNEMAVLSTYLSGTEKHIDVQTGKRISKARPIMCESGFEGKGDLKHLRHGQQPEGIPYIHDMPTLNPFWAAGFSFGRGHFVVNIPYDQHLPWIFQGEEISIGLRGFSYGYDYYSPERAACYHYYHRKKKVPMFWENSSTYQGSGRYGMNRLNSIIQMAPPNNKEANWIRTDELKYGIGKVRDMQQFFDVFGIHVKEQTVEHNLCKFVGQPMQKEFIPFLKPNEMGLDYDRIKYRFVNKWKDKENKE